MNNTQGKPSRRVEAETLAVLNGNTTLLNTLKPIDKSTNQMLLSSIAFFYIKGIKIRNLIQVFRKIPPLLSKKKIALT